MANAKLERLILALEKGTREGTVAWEETEEEGVYQASFPGYSLRASVVREEPHVQLYNESGRLMEDMVEEDFRGGIENAWTVFSSIFELARSKAMGVDEAVDVILKSLPEPDEKPKDDFRNIDFGGDDIPF